MIPELLSVLSSGNSLLLNMLITVENIAYISQVENLLYEQRMILFEGAVSSYLSILASKIMGV